jgi:HJR/Mrr/RecB family endonuclease
LTDLAIILPAHRGLHDYWVQRARTTGIDVESSINAYQGTEKEAVCETMHSLRHEGVRNYISRLARARRVFILMDELGNQSRDADAIVGDALLADPANKALLLASHAPSNMEFDAQFRVDLALRLTWSIVGPSRPPKLLEDFSVTRAIRQLAEDISAVDNMPWRHFERVVAALLEAEGYDVELMQGSKDGGIDIVAVKNDVAYGHVKLVVQVKRKHPKYKVDVTVVRQLSAVQFQNKATKGLIVTSTYLTRGALAMVETEKAQLAKIDRDDLNEWVKRAAVEAALSRVAERGDERLQ